MKVVLDTNVAVSGLLWGGTCERFYALAGDRRIALFTSEALLEEFGDILPRRKFERALMKRGKATDEVLTLYRESCTVLAAVPDVKVVAGDLDDDVPIACAVAARADLLVTGDKLLLGVGSYSGVRIVRPTDALRIIDERSAT